MVSSTFIFYLHYALLTSGLSGTSVLLGVFIKHYSDASSAEIGVLLMSFPFISIIIKPLFCSMADRYERHQLALILSLLTLLVGYTPFIVIPFYPSFYEQHPRGSWWILVVSCVVGNAGLGVGWSLGDALAVNIAAKTGTPFGRMRFMGTISWGVYGYIIGQINESPLLPKMVPGFVILHASVIVLLLFLVFWPSEDFKMCDPAEGLQLAPAESAAERKAAESQDGHQHQLQHQSHAHLNPEMNVDSTPGSLAGTLRCSAKTADALKALWASEELGDRLQELDENGNRAASTRKSAAGDKALAEAPAEGKSAHKSIQMVLFKLLIRNDKRLIKYLVLYTLFGFFMAPTNFVFLSLPEICKERGCNVSQLAGAMLICQAAVESVFFLIVPWFLARISRAGCVAFGFAVLLLRFSFYVSYYSTPSIAPEWTILGECGHGITYGILCTVLAEIALMFANESKLFIPEMRRLGLVSERRPGNEAQVELEENRIKMSLRATMQSLFSGFMDGLGNGFGSLLCGLVVDAFDYARLWQLLAVTLAATLLSQFATEVSRCRYSDYHRAKPGTRAFDILAFEGQERELTKRIRAEQKQRRLSLKANKGLGGAKLDRSVDLKV